MEIYTWRTTETKRGGKKTTRVDMRRRHTLVEVGWGWKRPGSCQLQKTQSSCTLMHTASHDKLHQREEGGGRHCTESTSTTMDGHTPNIHAHTYTLLHRVPVCVPPHSPGCQNLAVSLSRKEMKQQNNRLTNKRKEEHTLWIRLARIKK